MDYQEFYTEMNTHYYRADVFHTMRDPDQDCTSGNHHVINATYHLISSKLGGYTDPVQLSRDFVKELRFIKATEKAPGLYIRHPSKADQSQTYDDYVGLVVSSRLLSPLNTHYTIAQYGEHHWYYFDPIGGNLKWDSWHGKLLGLKGFYKRGADNQISLLNKLGYCASLLSDVYLSKDKTATSGKILLWLQNSVMKGQSPLVDKCINKWEEYIKATYPDQMGDVLGIYHGYDHPFSKAMKGKI